MITDIRAVNFWDWVDCTCDEGNPKKVWQAVRYEIQIKREDGEWMPINVVDRDNKVINIDPPDVSDHYQEFK
jgi:hypothetical protein